MFFLQTKKGEIIPNFKHLQLFNFEINKNTNVHKFQPPLPLLMFGKSQLDNGDQEIFFILAHVDKKCDIGIQLTFCILAMLHPQFLLVSLVS